MIIVPTSIFDVMEEADDFYFPPLVGNYIRFSRGADADTNADVDGSHRVS